MLTRTPRPVLRLLKHPHAFIVDGGSDDDAPERADLVERLADLRAALDAKRDGSPRNGFLASILLSTVRSDGTVATDWASAVGKLPSGRNARGGPVAYPSSPPRGFVEDARSRRVLGPAGSRDMVWNMPWWSVDVWVMHALCEEAEAVDAHEPALWTVRRLNDIVDELISLLGSTHDAPEQPTGQVHEPLGSIMRVCLARIEGQVERVVAIWIEHVSACGGDAQPCRDVLTRRDAEIRLRGVRIDGVDRLAEQLVASGALGASGRTARRLPGPGRQAAFDLCFGLEQSRRLIRLAAGRRTEREEGCLQPAPGNGVPPQQVRDTYPADVRYWHAEVDVTPAVYFASAARPFGSLAYFDPFGSADLPSHQFSSVTMGLGYSGSTYGLVRMAKGIFDVDLSGDTDELLVWSEADQAMTDARSVAGGLADIAILVRVPHVRNGHLAAHVLAAGRTGKGTERVGRILADWWPLILDEYGDRDPRREGIGLIFDVSEPVPRDRDEPMAVPAPLAVIFAPGAPGGPDRL